MADVLPCIGQTMQQESKQGIVPTIYRRKRIADTSKQPKWGIVQASGGE
jgi:hypothetical protein